MAFSNSEVYLNMAGGIRITEPAVDLAVAASLISALMGRPVPAECVFFGEIGLSGEVRAVSQWGQRLKESAKLGFTNACIAETVSSQKKTSASYSDMKVREIKHLDDLIHILREGIV